MFLGALGAAAIAAVAVGWGVTYADDGGDTDVGVPTRLSAVALSPTSVVLDWKGAKGAESYVVTYGPDRALPEATSARASASASTLTLTGLASASPGVDQYYRVDAVRGDRIRSSRTARFALTPAAPGAVTVRRTAQDGVRLAWKPVANARQFDVEIARDKAFTRTARAVRTLDAAGVFVARGLTPGTRYWARIRPVNGEQTADYSTPVTFRTTPAETSFKVGTWNVCSEKCKGYAGRARIMARLLDDERVDLFALQEAGGQRVGRTTNAIFSGHRQGFRRASGGAEAGYIFYRPALFDQLSGGYFGIGHGRHAVWARFRVKATGREFFFVDVHLENGKKNNGKRSSEMTALLNRMARINDRGLAIVYAGDFNSGRHRAADSPGAKMRAAGLRDSVLAAEDPVNAHINTSHSFGTSVPASGAHVDHIWVSEHFAVAEWKQLVRMNGRRYAKPVVSDHNALSAVVTLDAAVASVGKATPTVERAPRPVGLPAATP